MSYVDSCLKEHITLMKSRNAALGEKVKSLTDVWRATEEIIEELEVGLENWQEEAEDN